MTDYRDEYRRWCEDSYFDDKTRQELKALTSEEEIKDRFSRELEFGTGGLRGIMGAGLNRMNRYTVRKATQGLANYINSQERTERKAVIAYDSRHNSAEFAMEAALCLCANGIEVYLFDSLRPTPELSFAVRELQCMAGIVVTASHNPPEYNGYKVYWEDGAQITCPRDTDIMREVKAVSDFASVKYMGQREAVCGGLLHFIGEEIDCRYLSELKKLVQEPELLRERARELKIVYTPLHGTGNVLVRRILKELGFESVYVVEDQMLPDGDFPTVESPNPEDKRAFARALELAKETGADVVLATDPDADRLGVYARDEETGNYMAFTGNMSGMILCKYLLEHRKERNTLPECGTVVTTIVSGKMAGAVCREHGVKLIETLTGFKYIGEQIRLFEKQGTYEYLFGFEESYGCLVGTYSRDKDAVGAVMALCEAAVYYRTKGLTLWDQMQKLYKRYGYYKESIHTIVKTGTDGAAFMNRLMENMRNNPPKSLGGLKTVKVRDYLNGDTGLPISDVLYFELEGDSWLCIRPSGTEPKIKIYIGTRGKDEREAEARLGAIWEEAEKILEEKRS